MKLRLLAFLPWLLVPLAACTPDEPADDMGTGDTTGSSNQGPGGALLGCPPGGCVMVLAAQTLDDRIEVFVPEHPDSAYRGAISMDLKPNVNGDIDGELLDEPFGLVRTGTHLHVLAGHYPSRTQGSLISFPLFFFDTTVTEDVIAVEDYFMGGQFTNPVIGRNFEQVEPIFMLAHQSGRLLVGVFNNDLFAGEDTWTQTGRILVVDPANINGPFGQAELDALDGGICQGLGQLVPLSNTALGVACDGNEAVAVVDASNLDDLSVQDGAAQLEEGVLCPIPGALPGKRVRYLAPDGTGGFAVLEGPTGTDPQATARLWHMNPAGCAVLGGGPLDLGANGDWHLGEIAKLPAADPTWLLAAGSSRQDASAVRGVFVARNKNDLLQLCPEPLAGFENAWTDGHGGFIEPYSVDVTSDALHLAVGAGPYLSDPAGVGYGKVLWGSLSGSDTCALTATVVDLGDGGPQHAPAPTPDDPSTWRRGPNVVRIQEIGP
ncbi:hypothetical protein [Paraliomyxa miuraensis]|uniref:hypothetical protein n=1 Tax=Paraliomyxa miuraensis TaxID=376150 RepID=UPI00224EA9F3|nr:hypothetical protein [Paraliomyxa miuraensis]MCX4244281.1 hypothetical protein [Paraliomyxa miuraensis]